MITLRDMEIEAERGCNVFDAGDQLRDYVYRLTLEALDSADGLELLDTDGVRLRKEFVKKHFLEAIGGLPQRKPPLASRVTGTVECLGYRIEKVAFQSWKGVWVSANLYLPEKEGVPEKGRDGLENGDLRGAADGRSGLPGVVFVCGHDPEGKAAAEYQRGCIHLVSAQMAVLAIDSYGQGERSGYYDEACQGERIGRCTREHDYAGFQCMLLGDSTARYLLWDAIRAVDYLVSRPEIDASKIGITGNSGGGTLTLMMMIADERIAAAAPGTFVTSRRRYLQAGQPQDNEQIWPGLTRLGLDHRDGVLCMAPKPVLLLTAEHDFFPQKGTVETLDWCKRIWGLYGREEWLQLYKDDCMHAYSEGMSKRAASFFQNCFKIGQKVYDFSPIAILPSRRLFCSGTGYMSQEEKSLGIYEQNLARYREVLKERGKPDYDRTVSYLKNSIFRNRRPGELYPRKIRETSLVLDLCCDSYIWEAQEGLLNHCFLFYKGKEPKPVTIALWRDGCGRITDHASWLRGTCRAGRAVLVLDMTGQGMMRQREFLSWPDREGFYGARFKLNGDLLWLDDSLMALGCFDVLRSLDLLERLTCLEKGEVRLFACERYSLYGDVAALLDGRIKKVEYESPAASFGEMVEDQYYDPLDMAAFVLPGILKYADIPDIRRWRQEKFD